MSVTKYAPLHVHSFYSLLDGLQSPKDIAARCKELELPACAVTDHGSICGMKAFFDATKKCGIKPIIGIELYICQQDASIRTTENMKRWHLTVLAKNQDGLRELMELVTETNRPDYFYRKPRIHLEGIAPFAKNKNLICLSGCLGGMLSSSLFTDFKEACLASSQFESETEVVKFVRPDWIDHLGRIAEEHINVFGRENFFIELQDEGMPVQRVVMKHLRELAQHLDIPTVATLDAHYSNQTDATDQRILLYAQLHTTAEEQERLKTSGEDTMHFFHSDTYHIFSPDEMRAKFTDKELEASLMIADMVKKYSMGRQPCLPKFSMPDDKESIDSNDRLRQLVIKGAKAKLSTIPAYDKQKYWDRLQTELAVIKDAKLADYFLIEWDACNWLDEHKAPRGWGRGSGAGSLVNYVLDITDIDPIKYELYFERFYNAARSIPAHFNTGHVQFMEWLAENYFATIEFMQNKDRVAETRLRIASSCQGLRMKNLDLLRAEAKWIDENNPKIWMYLAMLLDSHTVGDNQDNSHIAYTIGVTDVLDETKPASYSDEHISLPDIDTDIGVMFRNQVIDYLSQRWGHDKVCQMVTFGRLQGKAALKEVFRAQPDLVTHLMRVDALKKGESAESVTLKPIDLCNEITSHIPDEAEINDELQQIRDQSGDDSYGILQWARDHIDVVGDYYKAYQPLFDQAIRIEGTKKSQSKHAAGVVICDRPIGSLVPMVYDPVSKNRVCGLEMSSAEAMGCVKFDFLGVVALDKIRMAETLINHNPDNITIPEDAEEGNDNVDSE